MPCCPHAERRENAESGGARRAGTSRVSAAADKALPTRGDTRIHLIWNETPSREHDACCCPRPKPREVGETVCKGGIRKRAISSVAHCDSDRAARCRSLRASSHVVTQLLTGDSGGCPRPRRDRSKAVDGASRARGSLVVPRA